MRQIQRYAKGVLLGFNPRIRKGCDLAFAVVVVSL